jgi:spore germination protein (amino acid permease)
MVIMESKIVFGKWEASALLINAICARIFLNFPRIAVEDSATAAWIEVVYFSIVSFLLFVLMQKLYKNFEGLDILDICEFTFGRISKVVLGFIYIFLFLFIGTIILREYAENLKVVSLPNTPISFIMAILLLAALVGAFSGIEAIVRFHVIVVPFIILGILIILIGAAKFYDINKIFPILGNGVPVILSKGLIRTSVFSPIIYLFFITPFIKTHKNFKLAGYIGMGISGLLLIVTAIVYLMVYPYPVSTESFLPVYQLSRLVSYGRFFQRIESIFLLIWVSSSLLYLSVILFFISYTFKKTFKIEYNKPLLIPFAIVIMSLSLLPPNLISAIKLEGIYNSFSGAITIALSLLILIGAVIKKDRRKRSN